MKLRLASISLLLAAAIPAALHAQTLTTAADLRRVAHEYYSWRDLNYPVASSDQGLHTWDERLTDYSAKAVAERRNHVRDLLARVKAISTAGWSKDDRIDWLLFRSQLEGANISAVLQVEEHDPQLYVGESANAIFSLLKKDYAPKKVRALAALARLRAIPSMLEQSKSVLSEPVGLYADLAIESARYGDSLFSDSVRTLATELNPRQQRELDAASKATIAALHSYADWLQSRRATMRPFVPMGKPTYEKMLRDILLLPFDSDEVAKIGEIELTRYRAMEALLPDPSLADPSIARSKDAPKDQAEFLSRYESREAEMVQFLRDKKLVTLPGYLGPFLIRQLPEAFKPTSPGGFMNPPGVYDADASGFYFIPTFNPKSGNFYIRAAIEDPRPILGHEGIPGHFLQLSIANHLTNEIRRFHGDNVFVEGWALYTEEMLMRTGLYAANSAGEGQILRLSRYRSARIGVDVNLHTGRWSFDEAVHYFMEAGGLDKESATGEAAGAASSPTQKISYITGKYQIMRLLGKYRDRHPNDFRLGQFHDELLQYGSLPLSVIEWLLLDDPSTLEKATGMTLR